MKVKSFEKGYEYRFYPNAAQMVFYTKRVYDVGIPLLLDGGEFNGLLFYNR